MKSVNKFTYTIAALFALIIFFFSSLVGSGAGIAHAATSATGKEATSSTTYSNVLDDLKKDESFNIADYPEISEVSGEYDLQVIQIAESTDGELFLYIYNPYNALVDLIANSVNISTAINENLSYKNYKLTQLSKSGVFSKYLVNGLSVKIDTVRYYGIASVFRTWNKQLDESAGGGNTTSEVPCNVSQLWTACTLNGTVSYEVIIYETIIVTEKYVGFVRYLDGFDFWGTHMESCDSHYIAFNTDKPIDKLLEADVYFITQSSHRYIGAGTGIDGITTLGDKIEKNVSLYYTDIASNSGDKLWGKKYSWNRIEKVSDFINKEDLQTDTVSILNGKQWVLRFYETDYITDSSGSPASGNYSTNNYSTLVSDVTILRLKFETEGIVYNLGAVDNKQTGDSNPDNNIAGFDFWQWLADFFGVNTIQAKIIFWCIVGLIILAVILPILSVFFPVFGQVMVYIAKGVGYFVKYLCIGLWFIISLPFKGIAALINRKKNGKKP